MRSGSTIFLYLSLSIIYYHIDRVSTTNLTYTPKLKIRNFKSPFRVASASSLIHLRGLKEVAEISLMSTFILYTVKVYIFWADSPIYTNCPLSA